jgi:hypothetical protein
LIIEFDDQSLLLPFYKNPNLYYLETPFLQLTYGSQDKEWIFETEKLIVYLKRETNTIEQIFGSLDWTIIMPQSEKGTFKKITIQYSSSSSSSVPSSI